MNVDLTALTQAVNDTVGVEESALVFISGIQQQLSNLMDTATDQVTVNAIAQLGATLEAEKAKLAAAIVANPTPAPAAPAAATDAPAAATDAPAAATDAPAQ